MTLPEGEKENRQEDLGQTVDGGVLQRKPWEQLLHGKMAYFG